MEVGILQFGSGTNPDPSRTLRDHCTARGWRWHLRAEMAPSIAAVGDFFSRRLDWLFIGAHFGRGVTTRDPATTHRGRFYNDNEHWDRPQTFQVVMQTGRLEFRDDTGTGSIDRLPVCQPSCLIISGCSIFSTGAAENVRALRDTFGQSVVLGYLGSAGRGMTNAMLVGQGRVAGFLARVSDTPTDATVLRQAWMDTAKGLYVPRDMSLVTPPADPEDPTYLPKSEAREAMRAIAACDNDAVATLHEITREGKEATRALLP